MSSSRARPRTLDPYLGAVLGGHHRIERLIGRGGMGLVYLARDTKHDRDVVVKLLAPQWLDDSTAVVRFEREGKRLEQLAHPNVVSVYECGHDQGQGYIVMEYLDGEPLRRYLKRRGRLSLAEFTPIAAQLLAAVGFAHDRGIMLRDIKPANIMLCERDGKASFVKLLDFGLAKLVDGDDEEVTKSHVIGTAGYLAPEQIKGEPCDLRADVYAIGVVLYLMLGGEAPVQGENDGALLYNHVHGTPRPLASLLPAGHNVPDALIALVHQCLEKDPARRPADAREVAEALFECVPPRLFALPAATDTSRKELADYRSARDRGLDEDAGPQSSEWTKPVVKPVGEPLGADASSAQLVAPARATPASPSLAASPAASPAGSLASSRAGSPAASPGGPRPTVRRGTPTSNPEVRRVLPPPGSRAASATTSPVAAPPVRLSRVRSEPVPAADVEIVEEVVSAQSTSIAASTAVATPRPVDPVATETLTPMPIEREIGSGEIPVRRVDHTRRVLLVSAGILAVALGGLAAWAMFGPTGGSATTAVASVAPEAPKRDGEANAPRTGAPALVPVPAPADASPVEDDEPVVIAPDNVPLPVVVRAVTGARISIDGVDVGAAPVQTDVLAGTHVLKATAPGYTAVEQTVEVASGATTFELKLRPVGAAATKRPKKLDAEVEPAEAADKDEIEEEVADEAPLPDKPPPLSSPLAKPKQVPPPPPPPPPAPDPTSSPFLPG
jgi:serine/threonine protein kinase